MGSDDAHAQAMQVVTNVIRLSIDKTRQLIVVGTPTYVEALRYFQSIKGAVVEYLPCKLGLPWCCVFVAAEMERAQDFS